MSTYNNRGGKAIGETEPAPRGGPRGRWARHRIGYPCASRQYVIVVSALSALRYARSTHSLPAESVDR